MADVVLDANVLVGWLDAGDVLAPRVAALASRLRADGHRLVFLDICVGEATRAARRLWFAPLFPINQHGKRAPRRSTRSRRLRIGGAPGDGSRFFSLPAGA
jgi:hypothetical protein